MEAVLRSDPNQVDHKRLDEARGEGSIEDQDVQ